MSKTLDEIAQQLKDVNKKVQLIYAFNGSGKTRLSRAFKDLIAPKSDDADNEEAKSEFSQQKVLYYNAFTEDLFYWDNDLDLDAEPKLKIQPNKFTDWVIGEQGQGPNIIETFQRYANDKLTPQFIEDDVVVSGKKTGKKTYPEVTFSIERGDDTGSGNIKISKGEESNFIWSIFYTLLEDVISILDEPNPAQRDNSYFDQLEYVFIDDPVSSLDDNRLIDLAVDLAHRVKASYYSDGNGLKFIITTHSPLFYNVLFNELNNDLYKKKPNGENERIYKHNQSEKYRLDKMADGTFALEKSNDHPFSYHLLLLSEIIEAIRTGQVQKYHFSFVRNILEKTATFLGHKRWPDLLPKTDTGQPDPFANRILNLSSHSAHAGEEIAILEDSDKEKLNELVKFIIEKYSFWQQEEQHG